MPSDHQVRPAAGALFVAAMLTCAGAFAPCVRADIDLPAGAKDVALTEGLVIADVCDWGRRTVNPDAIAEAMARGTLGTPREGDHLKKPASMGTGEGTWKSIRASEQGEFTRLPKGAYVLCRVRSADDRVVLLEASGHTMVYVNGEPHAGDPYSFGYARFPVRLHKGANQFVFAYAGREKPLHARLVAPEADVVVNTGDLTLPSVLSEKPEEYGIGVPLINASDAARTVVVDVREGDGEVREARVELAPLSVLKAPLRAVLAGRADHSDVEATIVVRDAAGGGDAGEGPHREISRASFEVHCKSPDEPHSRTFVSEIDGSVQYAAITPQAVEGRIEHPGLVVSLHGADVEAVRQAPCYQPKPDLVIVCPTNRRPYGFDWEVWGRVDAAEAMDAAKGWFHTDPRRQYLTGHSMGGHGVWQVGSLMADRFAAIAPSAGWISFDTYANVRGEDTDKADNQLRTILRRAAASTDTFALMPNLRGKGIYILHGDADDNVPVTEARSARDELTRLGIEFTYHEQPGAGHWWDDDKPGVGCVDWPPIFDMFRSRTLPKPGEQREFHVCALQSGIADAASEGVSIIRAEHPGKVARADVKIEPASPGASGRMVVTTDNVCMLALGERAICAAAACPLEIDGQAVRPIVHGQHLCLVKRMETGRWEDAGADPAFSASLTSAWDPPRGPFKNAFTHRFVMVYGTRGTAEENAWSLARARFDAEQWWYRGNGRAVLMTDDAFCKALDSAQIAGNAILYGNSDTNGAANRLTAGQAVRVTRSEAVIGGRKITGDDLGVLAIGTFKGADGPRVYGLVSGTGVVGSRSTDRIPVILSGTGIPDVCVIRAGLWTSAVGGIECAGFLDQNMRAEKPDLIWRE
ncbi:MAG TPA: prolyl oligopeptidase family serine peptidase [Phycisphaerales bacterium]|nr:prolyl oligopeptidase family serine peptidase [Phycisphaerales bacterium]